MASISTSETIAAMAAETAYLAGFFDGEGTVFIQESRGRHYLRISVTQVNPEPLKLFQVIFGGTVLADKDRPNRRKIYRWRLGGDRAALALLQLLPYLIVKLDEARLGIIFQEEVKNRHRRLTKDDSSQESAYYHKMREYKKREWITSL